MYFEIMNPNPNRTLNTITIMKLVTLLFCHNASVKNQPLSFQIFFSNDPVNNIKFVSYNSEVIVLVISNQPCATSLADLKSLARLLPEFRLNCTLLSPITITNHLVIFQESVDY